MRSGSSFVVPNYIQAKSLRRLRLLMLKNNVANGKQYHYFDFTYNPDKKVWVCWFESEMKPELKADKK